MIKKIILTVVTFFAIMSSAFAATYYVRPNGGTASQCNGTVDFPYPDLTGQKNCAFNHPFWAVAPQGNNPSAMVGGDTLIIDGTNAAQYQIGLGAPNTSDTSKCSSSWPWDCYMRSIPSGPSASQPTRILGKGFDTGCMAPPQLWGTQHLSKILNLTGSSNVEIQCVEVTDHSDCLEMGPTNGCNRDSYPYGPWASIGLEAWDSSNVLLKNVNIHGLRSGVHAGRLKDWTLDHLRLMSNSFVGWDGDIGAFNSSNSGTMHFIKSTIKFSGCGEKLDGTPYNCYSQGQGGYGDGLGTHKTGAAWIFDDCDFSNNVSDNLDLLYHDGTAPVTINGGHYNDGAGNDIKVATSATINNVESNGHCNWFTMNPQYLWNPATFDNCRAQGNNISLLFSTPGQKVTINGGTIAGNGDVLIMTAGAGCNGTESVTTNSVTLTPNPVQFGGGGDSTHLFYNAGQTGNGDGPCGNIKFIQTGNPVPTPTPTPTPVPTPTPTPVPTPVPSPCVPTWCDAPLPQPGQVLVGKDSCGNPCSKFGSPATICPPLVVCPACPVCPAPVVCQAPTLTSVTANISSNGKNYSLTK